MWRYDAVAVVYACQPVAARINALHTINRDHALQVVSRRPFKGRDRSRRCGLDAGMRTCSSPLDIEKARATNGRTLCLDSRDRRCQFDGLASGGMSIPWVDMHTGREYGVL